MFYELPARLASPTSPAHVPLHLQGGTTRSSRCDPSKSVLAIPFPVSLKAILDSRFSPTRQDWMARLMSTGGRMILVNAVLSSLAVYHMASLLFPKTVVEAFDAWRRSFLWTGEDKCHGSDCLVASKKVCQDKASGSLGVTNLNNQNHCLLLKIVHKLFEPGELPWKTWFWGQHPNPMTVTKGYPFPDIIPSLAVVSETGYPRLSGMGVAPGRNPGISFPHPLLSQLSTHLGGHFQPRLTQAAAAELEVLEGHLTLFHLTANPDIRSLVHNTDASFTSRDAGGSNVSPNWSKNSGSPDPPRARGNGESDTSVPPDPDLLSGISVTPDPWPFESEWQTPHGEKACGLRLLPTDARHHLPACHLIKLICSTAIGKSGQEGSYREPAEVAAEEGVVSGALGRQCVTAGSVRPTRVGPAHVRVFIDIWCEMAGFSDHQFVPGATIWFGSLEFLVNGTPDVQGNALHLVLIDRPSCSALGVGQVPQGGLAVITAASTVATTAAPAVSVASRSPITVSRVGRERILHHHGGSDSSTFGLTFVLRPQKPNDQEGWRKPTKGRGPWEGLERAHPKMRLLRYEGILGGYEKDLGVHLLPRGDKRCPTLECFTVVPPDDLTNGANAIAAKQQELEDMRLAIEIEQAQLDANMEPSARARAREVGQRNETNADGYLLFDRASQCIATAMLLSRQLPQPALRCDRQQAPREGDGSPGVGPGIRDLLVLLKARRPNPDAAKVQDRLGPDRDARHTMEARRRDKSEEPEDRVPQIRHRQREVHVEAEEDWDSNSDSDCPGPAAFSHEIRTIAIPPRFRLPTNFSKYDGETDPSVWLDDFRLACRAGGAFDDNVIIRNLPLYLAEPARAWLERLPNGKICNWADLRSIFVGNFQGTCARPGKVWDLKRCKKRHGETLCEYLRWFSRQYSNLPDSTDADVIAALMGGTKNRSLVNRIGRECPKMIKEVLDMAAEEAQGEEAVLAHFPEEGGKKKPEETADEAGPSGHHEKKKKKRRERRVEFVAVADPQPSRPQGRAPQGRRQDNRPQGQQPNEGQTPDYFEQLLEGPCPNHATPVKHKYRECGLMRKFLMGMLDGVSPTTQPLGKGTATDSFPEPDECLMIFGGPEAQASKRHTKLMERDMFAVHLTHQEFLRWSEAAITFDRSDHPRYVPHPGKFPLVVASIIGKKRVSKVLMDGGSSLNILYGSTLDALGVPRSHVRPERAPFYGVVPGKEAVPLGQITLRVTFGDRENFRTETFCFEVVDFDGSYHAILGRPCSVKFMAVPNYVYLKLKMPGPNGVAYECEKESCALAAALVAAAVQASKELAVSQEVIDAMAAMISVPEDQEVRQVQYEDSPACKKPMLEPEVERQFQPSSDTKKVLLDPQGSGSKTESALVDCLRANIGMFAWVPAHMPGIHWEVAEHSLDIRKGAKPVRQPTRRCNEFKRKIITEEVAKLLDAGFIREVRYPEWLANPVLVVDSTAGCEALCFLDAYSGYHQIALKESDQLATSFVTPCDVFCYTTMAFGLKNAGATFQRCMNQCLGDLIGRTVEVYVDDIVVKSKRADDLVQDLEATFDRLRANRVKLNPEKCVFGVSKGLLLGFVVSARGIEANPEKIAAIANMGPIDSVKDVQKLTGCLAVLGRFVPRLGKRGLPLYKLLKRAGRFEWTVEAQQALDQLKHMLTKPPILVPPREGERLLLYVSATTQVVSAVLVVEREVEGHALKVQHPVYYISEVLTESKTRYLHIQKMIYAILIAKRKLRHYFDAHHVTVVTEHALGEVINNREAIGRIAKWSLELMGYDISYAPRSAIKSQVLTDFVAEWTETQLPPAPADL
ncbi:hypothetical protein HU200_016953 [Digitaria exilis]|uniref:Reverse transcriptase n=1 Tax=Digitaria exilis TaxID=1010633 RepID=A0A835F816_9POAL|nr:hypothetical protein HU200_016953 [Digitaria exilis]